MYFVNNQYITNILILITFYNVYKYISSKAIICICRMPIGPRLHFNRLYINYIHSQPFLYVIRYYCNWHAIHIAVINKLWIKWSVKEYKVLRVDARFQVDKQHSCKATTHRNRWWYYGHCECDTLERQGCQVKYLTGW